MVFLRDKILNILSNTESRTWFYELLDTNYLGNWPFGIRTGKAILRIQLEKEKKRKTRTRAILRIGLEKKRRERESSFL